MMGEAAQQTARKRPQHRGFSNAPETISGSEEERGIRIYNHLFDRGFEIVLNILIDDRRVMMMRDAVLRLPIKDSSESLNIVLRESMRLGG